MGRKKSKNPTTRADKAAPDIEERQQELCARFARNLVAKRQEKGLSQTEMAFRAGLPRSYVNRVESGAVSCNLPNAYFLAKALGVSLNRLCQED